MKAFPTGTTHGMDLLDYFVSTLLLVFKKWKMERKSDLGKINNSISTTNFKASKIV